jgi:uncharacterized protein (DUF2267 family)
MLLDFDRYAVKGNEFLHQLEANLGTKDRKHAARILRNTFRVLRNHLMQQESFDLLAQLPMALKSVYVDGWKLADHERLTSLEHFLSEIIHEDDEATARYFSSKEDIINGVRAVIETMQTYVSAEELHQAFSTLPREVRHILLEDRTIPREED